MTNTQTVTLAELGARIHGVASDPRQQDGAVADRAARAECFMGPASVVIRRTSRPRMFVSQEGMSDLRAHEEFLETHFEKDTISSQGVTPISVSDRPSLQKEHDTHG